MGASLLIMNQIYQAAHLCVHNKVYPKHQDLIEKQQQQGHSRAAPGTESDNDLGCPNSLQLSSLGSTLHYNCFTYPNDDTGMCYSLWQSTIDLWSSLSLCNFFYSMKFCSANTKNWIIFTVSLYIFKNSFWICMVNVKLGGTQLAVLHSTYQSFLGSWFLSTKHSQILMSIAVPCSHRL